MSEKKFTDEEIESTMSDLVVWHVGSGLRLMGRRDGNYLKDVVRIDVDILGRTPQGQILKSPTLSSVDYSLTPIPKYFIQDGSPHYKIRDLDKESALATAKMYLSFCHDLKNWKDSKGPQLVVPVKPGAVSELNRMASMMPGGMPTK